MTCYFRGLKEIFQKADITVTPQNKKQIDKIIQTIVGLENEHCPAVWKQVKKRIAEDEPSFVAALQNAWNTQQH
jgi:hypothetical protein